MKINQEQLLRNREIIEKNRKQAPQRIMLSEKARKKLKQITRQK